MRILDLSLSQLASAHMSIAAAPASQMSEAMGRSTCSGFALAAGSGAKAAAKPGFMALLSAGMPVSSEGVRSIMMPSGSVAALGMRLRALSMLQGRARRRPTTAQSSSTKRFGAFLSTKRRTTTAGISQPAAMLMFSSF